MILAVVLGLILGAVVNMGLVVLGPAIIPNPPGVDAMDIESIRANIDLFEPKHLLFPFIAHALGTFVGAALAAKMAKKEKMKAAMAVGVLFLLGGILNLFNLPLPVWFAVVDLVLAYIPMAWLGHKAVVGLNK